MQRFSLNQAAVAAKVIHGEAVLINLVSGRYYSLCDAACDAWVVLSAGGSLDDAVEAVTSSYDVDERTLRGDLDALVDALLDEALLVADGAAPPADPPPTSRQPPTVRKQYRTLELQTFTDMEDLLAFDPPLPRAPEQVWRAPAD
jgi:hypothetical protein